MSLLTLAHQFSALNSLTIREFCTHFGKKPLSANHKLPELNRLDLSALDIDVLEKNAWSTAPSNRQELFSSDISVTDLEAESDKKLRYCSACLRKGYHFSFQQLTWLSRCPLHDKMLTTDCGCARSPGYVLNRANRPARQLCGCGELQLGEPSLSPEEESKLTSFVSRLAILRDNLASGISSIRVNLAPPDNRELLDTFKILRQMLSGLTTWPSVLQAPASLENRMLILREGDGGSVIDQMFEQYFHLACERSSWDARKTRLQCAAVALLERNLLGRGGARRGARSQFEKNTNNEPIEDGFLKLAVAATSIRVLEEAYRLNLPVNDFDGSNFKRLVKAYAQPACLIWSPPNSALHPQIYWLNDSPEDSPSDPNWVDEFAQFYFCHVIMGRHSANVANRKLNEAEDEQARRYRFAFPGDSSKNPHQTDLFGCLAD